MDILIRREGRAGRVTLNRPRSMNALSRQMVHALEEALSMWVEDPDVELILIDAAGGRAFSVGGDIAEVHGRVVAGDRYGARAHCAAEYRLDRLIHRCPKPVVSLMNGTVMGGGTGISAHASHPVATERTLVAMPECAIGFIPDAGTTSILARSPGHLGEFLGLTGARIGPADVIRAGFAKYFVPSERLSGLIDVLIDSGDPNSVLSFAATPESGELETRQTLIDEIFGLQSVPEILDSLQARKDDQWCQAALRQILRGSPISLVAALRAIRRVRADPSIETALATEYRVVCRCMDQGDFLEGVRAVIIDMDRNPQWRFPSTTDVPDEFIDRFFEPVATGGLEF